MKQKKLNTLFNMENYLILQVRVNLIQQNLVTLQNEDSTNFQRIANDILNLYNDVINSNNQYIEEEYLPQIENLCTMLTQKKNDCLN